MSRPTHVILSPKSSEVIKEMKHLKDGPENDSKMSAREVTLSPERLQMLEEQDPPPEPPLIERESPAALGMEAPSLMDVGVSSVMVAPPPPPRELPAQVEQMPAPVSDLESVTSHDTETLVAETLVAETLVAETAVPEVAVPEVAVSAVPVAPAAPAERPRRKRTDDSPRDFVIAYDGVFVGHFRSARRITNRSAFRSIARQIRGQMGDDFDPDKLALFKPVPLTIKAGATAEEIDEGSFTWF